MNMQLTAKEVQEYTEDSPKCSNCEYFSYSETKKTDYYGGNYIYNHSFKCKLGEFKVKKMSWCKEYECKIK